MAACNAKRTLAKAAMSEKCHKQTHAPPCGLALRPGGAARPFLAAIVIQELAGASFTAGRVPEGLV